MNYLVEGRHFGRLDHAFSFALTQAARMSRSVDVKKYVRNGNSSYWIWVATAYATTEDLGNVRLAAG